MDITVGFLQLNNPGFSKCRDLKYGRGFLFACSRHRASRKPSRKFPFHISEKDGRAQNQKCKEHFLRGKAAVLGGWRRLIGAYDLVSSYHALREWAIHFFRAKFERMI